LSLQDILVRIETLYYHMSHELQTFCVMERLGARRA